MLTKKHAMKSILILAGLAFLTASTSLIAAEVYPLSVGWAMTDITPPEKIALVGQKHKRISEGVMDPLRATILAVETVNNKGVSVEQAIFVSCDLCFIRKKTQDEVQAAVAKRLPQLDTRKIFLNATHTHTAPQQVTNSFRGLYDVSNDEGVWTAAQYREFLVRNITNAIVKAWSTRTSAGFSWGLGHAAVGHNRRAAFFDGTTKMYGRLNQQKFDRLEGYTDHGVQMLCFWDENQNLTGLVVNLACPSQETEGLRVISADFWHDVREELWKRYSKDVFILPQCAAAGDISPHHMFRKQPELTMLKRKGITSRQQIAKRIVDAINETVPYLKESIQTEVVFKHSVTNFTLPKPTEDRAPFYFSDDPDKVDFHFIRLGDIALASNPFELYLDYGIRIQSRSPALMTLNIQLSNGVVGYLPTRQAVRGGGYSAEKFIIGPEGGDALVEESLTEINALFPK